MEVTAAVAGLTAHRKRDEWRRRFREEERGRYTEVPPRWVPELNRFGGWYGLLAKPGEVRIAFVGEEVNTRAVPEDWPPLYGGPHSGFYLTRAILLAHLDPKECYYTNSIKPKGVEQDLEEELHEVMPSVVVALGSTAARKLWNAGVSHHRIPHPSFWSRWCKGRGGINSYAKIIEEVASGEASY